MAVLFVALTDHFPGLLNCQRNIRRRKVFFYTHRTAIMARPDIVGYCTFQVENHHFLLISSADIVVIKIYFVNEDYYVPNQNPRYSAIAE